MNELNWAEIAEKDIENLEKREHIEVDFWWRDITLADKVDDILIRCWLKDPRKVNFDAKKTEQADLEKINAAQKRPTDDYDIARSRNQL